MKQSVWMITPIIIFSLLGGQYIAHADDDDEYDEDKYYEENNQYLEYNSNIVGQGQWNIWTRSITDNTNSTLPFEDAKTATFKIDNHTFKLYVIPKKGEIFVPAGKLTKLVDGQSKYYKNSKIIDLEVNGNRLIFRAETNVVYENLIKTPMSAKAYEFNHDIYVPVSVVINSLGYSIEWKEETQQFICREL